MNTARKIEVDADLFQKNFQKDLALAIAKLSSYQIDEKQANDLAEKALVNIDFTNSALNHKGVNWFAKKIINTVL